MITPVIRRLPLFTKFKTIELFPDMPASPYETGPAGMRMSLTTSA
jgi:hypothetical protein